MCLVVIMQFQDVTKLGLNQKLICDILITLKFMVFLKKISCEIMKFAHFIQIVDIDNFSLNHLCSSNVGYFILFISHKSLTTNKFRLLYLHLRFSIK